MLKGKKMSTKIQWTDESWQPVVGCTKVSAGCDNCYAEKMAERLAAMACSIKRKKPPTESMLAYTKAIKMWFDPKTEKSFWKDWSGKTICIESVLDKPLHWKKPRKIFVCSMGDLFHPGVPFAFVADVLSVLSVCKHHTGQILTKRPDRMLEIFTDSRLRKHISKRTLEWDLGYAVVNPERDEGWPLSNVWLGVTAENQKCADERIPILLQIPAEIRFLSIEPCLSSVDLCYEAENSYCKTRPLHIDWVIIGCESGPKRRPCKLEWVRSIVEQCKAADVPVFVKQLSINGKVSHKMFEWPEDLRVRQYPKN